MPKYQLRVREDLSESDLDIVKSAKENFGSTQVTKIISYNSKEVDGLQELLDALKEAGISEASVISIIAIDEDNSDQLGEDFDWDDV